MRIRQRMLIMELSTAAAFLIAITLFFILLHNIINLKNLEIETQKVLNDLNRLNYTTYFLISSRDDFEDLKESWDESILSYSQRLDELKTKSAIWLVGTKLTSDLDQLAERWETMKRNSLVQMGNAISAMMENRLRSKIGDHTLAYMNTLSDESMPDTMSVADTVQLRSFFNEHKITSGEIEKYSTVMKTLIFGISVEIQKGIRFVVILILAILFLIIAGALAAAYLYAGGLSRQIKQVQKTAELVTAGNFNVKLDIRSSDEFRSLSDNFNSFTDMLWSRLDAVRTIMKDMAEISGEMDDIKNVEREILNLAVKNAQADAGAIFLYDAEENILRPTFVHGDFPPPYPIPIEITHNQREAFAFFRKTDIKPGENIIGKVASTGEAVFVKTAEEPSDLPQRWSNDPLHISSFMAIPLLISNNVLGVFALAKTEPYVSFSDLSFTNMKTFGEYTALSIDNRYKYNELKEKFELSRELSIATDIQQGLRLKKVPRLRNVDISTYHRTARGISGDYYDIFKISESKTAVIICDVAGKGIPAALVMVMIRTILRVIAHPDRDAGTMLTILNSTISGKVGSDQYATMGIIIIDSSNGEMTFSNAASLPLHIYRKEDDRFSNFNTEGLPVGVEGKTVYPQQVIRLQPGDVAAICTDGLTEARNIHGNEFSIKTLLREIKKYADKDAGEIADIIGKEMEIFLRGSFLYDDQSLLIMKYKGA